jgi:uncharacterized protein
MSQLPVSFCRSGRVPTALILLGLALATGAVEQPAAPATDSAWRTTVRLFAAKHFRHPAWGYAHSQRDYELARQLAAADHVALDDDVLYAAAYLHDIAAFPPWANPNVDHADEAARIVDSTLGDTGFPMAKIEAVRGAIRTHMYNRDPIGPEALYLHDADSLDWLGAIGVARMFATVDAAGGMPDGPTIAHGLQDLLTKVPARIFSPAGRKQLESRRAELARFLVELKSESHDLQTL